MPTLLHTLTQITIPMPANSPEPVQQPKADRPRLTRAELEDLFAIELGRVTLH